MKINKDAAGDTASLLYQSNWMGHAEMGLTGSTDFHIKVSADGAVWTDAMVFDGASGQVQGAAVQASATDTTPDRLALTEGTFGPGSVLGTVGLSGGVPTGGIIERGSNSNGSYVRFADGTQICTVDGWTFSEEASGMRLGGGNWIYPAVFSQTPTVTPSFSNSVGTHWIGTNTQHRVSIFGCGTATSMAATMRIFAVETTPFVPGAQALEVRLLAIGV
ncbi:hypothetical protein [Tateyamaria sp. SN6-1]|uniref:hypothetical protein n=1 Tax=Tateyamaria sp. SN6-1 TaxID=3092148 RepID=UPI0039F5E329